MMQVNFIITTKSEASPGRKEHEEIWSTTSSSFPISLPHFPPGFTEHSLMYPSVSNCFRSVFHRGFFLQFQKHPKALTQTDLCFSAMKIQIPGREGNFLCLFQSWLVLRHTTDNTLNVSVLTNPGPLTLISPMSRGHAATTFYSMWVWVLQKGVLKAGRRWILLIPSENKLLSQCPEPSTLTSAGLRHKHTDISSH